MFIGGLMSNIINFPSREQLEQEREDFIIDVILDLSIGVFQRIDLLAEGLDINLIYSNSTEKDMMLIHEAIKSCIFRMRDKEHFLHKTADSINLDDIKEIKFETHIDDIDE